MISKKLAATLGTGALGAAGAGTLGAKMLGKNKWEEKSEGVNWRGSGESFAGALKSDDRTIDDSSLTWTSTSTGIGSVMIEAKGSNFSWKCSLKPILTSRPTNLQTNEQGKKLLKEIEGYANKAKREQFVKNCSGGRLSRGKMTGGESNIELEQEEKGGQKTFKGLERLWTTDFRGVEKLTGEDLKAFKETNVNGWKIEDKGESKIKISIIPSGSSKEWSCLISGKHGSGLESKTFKESELTKILKATMGEEKEKKGYLIRNCVKNNKEIKGLEIEEDQSNWWFKAESIKKITEGMYENSLEAKP